VGVWLGKGGCGARGAGEARTKGKAGRPAEGDEDWAGGKESLGKGTWCFVDDYAAVQDAGKSP